MTSGPDCPIGFDDLLAYLVDDLTEAELGPIEDHLFECARCGRRLESIDRVRRAVADAVQRAEVGASVNTAFLERAEREGLSLREYRIPRGATVACTAGPEDLVLVRLALGAREAAETAGDLLLDVTFEDLERREAAALPPREVVVDRDRDEVMLVFPGAAVRAYPRSRWTMHLRGAEAGTGDGRPGSGAELGTFIMDHTPAADS